MYCNKPISITVNDETPEETLQSLKRLGFEQASKGSYKLRLKEEIREKLIKENPDSSYLSRNGNSKIHTLFSDLKQWHITVA